jgi:hypothetical protein
MAKTIDKSRLQKRNAKIVKRFYELSDIKTVRGKRKYSYEFIYEKLADQFYLSEYTIGQIIKKG